MVKIATWNLCQGLKNKKKYLIKKLKELQRSITLSGNIEKMIGQDIPSLNFVQKNSLEEYLMQNKHPTRQHIQRECNK